MGLISRASSRTYRERGKKTPTMNNQHPMLRWFVRICGVRNHRPHTRQPVVQATRDYPPAFIPPLPNDKLSDSWYCNRDDRRAVEPNKKLAEIPDAINDSKYPVPGWGTQWTLSEDEQYARHPTGRENCDGAIFDGYMK